MRDTILIAIIVTSALYGEIAEDTHLTRLPLIELIAKTSEEINLRQSTKPGHISWDTFCEQIGLNDWEEWVIAQAREILDLNP